MQKLVIIIILNLIFIEYIFIDNIFAHEVNYQVKEGQGICVSFFFAGGEPMNYADVEVYAPYEKIIFQKARTDKNGIFCFMPDRAGTWKIIAKGETEHGLHRAEVSIKINKNLNIESFKKPLVARYTKIFIALGIVGWILGLTGIYLYFKSRKP